MPLEITEVGSRPFEGRIEAARVGTLTINRITTTGIRTDLTPAAIRRTQIGDTVSVGLQLAGGMTFTQSDREAVLGAGDLVVLDRRQSSLLSREGGQGLFIEVPQERLERVIGPAKLYSRIRIPAEQGTTQLASRFFEQLLQVHRRMEPGLAERMSSIGVDLLVASIAERSAQEISGSVHGNVVVQRAKAQIEDTLHDPELSTGDLALAVGVSLRRLQELFHERGQNISDYIWERRLAVAARRLQESHMAQIPIGLVAYACGFSSQAHFSRRFKERYGVTPRDYRVAHFRQTLASAAG